jgi:hypothetical protein
LCLTDNLINQSVLQSFIRGHKIIALRIIFNGSYNGGNTITTSSGNNIAITLAEVASPTSLTIENADTAGVSAQRIFNSIASGTLTNGLLIEQTGAGTMTNGIQIAETAGTITDGNLSQSPT